MAKNFGSQYQALKHVPERSLTCLKKLIMWECETLEVFPCGLNNLIAGKLSSVSVERRAENREQSSESGKFALWWAIFIEGVLMTMEFGENTFSIC